MDSLLRSREITRERDVWICHPLNSERAGFNTTPAFCSCVVEMMTPLLRTASRPKGRGVRHRRLKVTKISGQIGGRHQRKCEFDATCNPGELPRAHGAGYGANLFAKRRPSTSLRVEIRASGFSDAKFQRGVQIDEPVFLESDEFRKSGICDPAAPSPTGVRLCDRSSMFARTE